MLLLRFPIRQVFPPSTPACVSPRSRSAEKHLFQGLSAYEHPAVASGGPQGRGSAAPELPETQDPSFAQGYVQQYDARGYPENSASRALARASRRAQNDILSAVGVCVGVGKDGKPRAVPKDTSQARRIERENVNAVRQENEIGLFIAAADNGLLHMATNFAAGLRNRLQASSSAHAPPFGSLTATP